MKNLLFIFVLISSFTYAVESDDTVSLSAPHTLCVYYEGGSKCVTFEDPKCDGDMCFTGVQTR